MEWDECRAHYDHGPTVRYIFRRQSGEWRPWVCIADSHVLRRLGRRGLGLFAARPFRAGDVVGRYDGRLVGHFATRRAALEAPQTRRLLRRGHDKLVTLRRGGRAGVALIDGAHSGPPHIALCNDPRRTRLRANCALTEAGNLRVTAAHVPAFDLDRADNTRSELRWDYGDAFWEIHDALGTCAEWALEVG
jgi:hypothetical protein